MLTLSETTHALIEEDLSTKCTIRSTSKHDISILTDDKVNKPGDDSQDFISYINIGSSLGPLTHTNSFNDITNEIDCPTKVISTELSTLSTLLQTKGILLTKVTRSKHKLYLFKLNQNNSKILWRSDTKSICLDAIKDIRVGKMASNYMEEYHVPFTNRWITILYIMNKKLKIFHAIAKTDDQFQLFYQCICNVVKLRKELMESMSLPDHAKFATIHWNNMVSEKKEDQLKDTLTFEQVKRLCDRFHIYCSVTHLRRIFDKADINHNQLLNFREFQEFVKLLKTRREITTIWNEIAKGDNSISIYQFGKFIYTIQGETQLDSLKIKHIFDNYSENNEMNEDLFTRFLNEQPYLIEIVNSMDYSKPLNHYFIASSHNTYLLGKQYAEKPSVEGYVQVLQQGCRCVEIDIWDGETGPVVCHGILTASIPLLNVVKIIKKYAFIVSPYPLIISLEIHCNKENQKVTSQIMKDTLGTLIYNDSDKNGMKNLPSPSDLKHRILIKVKKPKAIPVTSTAFKNITDGHSKIYSSSSIYEYTSFSFSSSNDSEFESTTDSLSRDKHSDDTSTLKLIPNVTTNSMTRMKRIGLKKRAEITNSIFEISNIHGLKFRNFSLPESKTLTHCFSLNEKKFESLFKDSNQKLSMDKHNRRFLMRIYPHTLRYNSTNFNPIKFWKAGVQMVATNWQTNDIGQQINLAMFQLAYQKSNLTHSGYVLKPESLLQTVSKIKDIPKIYKSIGSRLPKSYNINLKVISGQLLPRIKKDQKNGNNFGPYIAVEFLTDDLPNILSNPLSVVKNGTASSLTSSYSIVKEGNGFNPVWDMELNIQLKQLDFTFIRFVVKTNEIPLATSCVKLDYLKRGYRHIPLYNMSSERYIFSTIFIYSRIDPIR
ncbi:1-phosphatidylinositol 4,5-bisphosphate phosphodiesterase 1 [Monosporozyma unispora]